MTAAAATAAEEQQLQQPVAESVGSAMVAMPLVRRLKQAAGDVPGLLEIVQDGEQSLPKDCHALSEVYKVAVDAGQSGAGAAQDLGYRELCVKHMRLLCKIKPDEARDFHNRQRAFALHHGDARLYEARAALEEQQGDRAKALKMVNEGLRLGAQPVELLQQFLLDFEDRGRQPPSPRASVAVDESCEEQAILEETEMVQDMDLVEQQQQVAGESQSSGEQPGSSERSTLQAAAQHSAGSSETDCVKSCPGRGRSGEAPGLSGGSRKFGSQCASEAVAPRRPSKLQHPRPPLRGEAPAATAAATSAGAAAAAAATAAAAGAAAAAAAPSAAPSSAAPAASSDSCSVFDAAVSGDPLSSSSVSGGRHKLQRQRLQQQLRRQEAQQSRAKLQRLLASTERRRSISQTFAAWKEVLDRTACRRREALFDSMRQQVQAAQRRCHALERRLELQARLALLRWAAGAWRSFIQLGRQTQRLADIAHQSGLRRSITRMLLEWRVEARCSVMCRSAQLGRGDQTPQSNPEPSASLECLLQDMAISADDGELRPQAAEEVSPVLAPTQNVVRRQSQQQEMPAQRRTLTRSASAGPQRPAGMPSREGPGAGDWHAGCHSRSALHLSPRLPLTELQSVDKAAHAKEAAGTPSAASEAKQARSVRGPERFFYDTSTYTGCARVTGPVAGKENGKPSTEARGGHAPRKTRPPASGGGAASPVAAGAQQAARRQNASLLR
eukprot:TRINITY_DN1611_c0_g1_i2.p1 TRINITY_DN1611_c0_g1~~TRINITY_DN1611_c0_g1_i2.p1  ORF type:complete len:726 (+),score=189.61 TRINITY_DN1611_c0_g1_i2:164-2341(+)